MAINTLYMDREVLKKAREVYEHQNPKNIRLEQFFQPAVFALLQKKIFSAAYRLHFDPKKWKYEGAKVEEMQSFLAGGYFKNIVGAILGLKKFRLSFEVRKFSPGSYTLLHDAEKEQAGIDVIIDCSLLPRNNSGCVKYLTIKEELLQLDPSPNTLSFVERKKGVMRYVKYVNHQQSPIILVMGTIFKKKP